MDNYYKRLQNRAGSAAFRKGKQLNVLLKLMQVLKYLKIYMEHYC